MPSGRRPGRSERSVHRGTDAEQTERMQKLLDDGVDIGTISKRFGLSYSRTFEILNEPKEPDGD